MGEGVIAGVRLGPGTQMIWVESALSQLPPDHVCLLRTPEGERTATVVVAPQLLFGEAPVTPGFRLLRSLTGEEALSYEPAASIREAVARELGGLNHVRARVAPDGSRVTLLTDRAHALEEAAGRLMERLGIVVVLRNAAGMLPDPPLPELLAEVEWEGASFIVERISVFHGQLTLRKEDGETTTIPLADWQRAQLGER